MKRNSFCGKCSSNPIPETYSFLYGPHSFGLKLLNNIKSSFFLLALPGDMELAEENDSFMVREFYSIYLFEAVECSLFVFGYSIEIIRGTDQVKKHHSS